jgi:ornithine cyclodeaminase/alanine dehydrogenase-like protein (mu-crystallin family)
LPGLRSEKEYALKTLILSKDDVHLIAQRVGVSGLMDELIQRLITTFRNYDPATTVIPARSGFNYETPHPGLIEWMPVMTGHKVTLKIVGYHPTNPTLRNLPTIVSTINAYDTLTGHWLSVADGNLLTALRTGAATAVASRFLAHAESHVVGIIGTGMQAVTQLHALSRVFDLEAAIVYDADPQASRTFRNRTAFLDLEIGVVEGKALDFLVKSADILCTCTSVDSQRGPVFADGEHKPWLHVNAVGSDFPGKFEVPLSLLKRSLVVPDFLDQATKEGECQRLAPHEIGPVLAEVVKHPERYAAARETPTVFDSTGWALEDMVVLEMFTDYAREMGIGSEAEVESITPDPRDPYFFVHQPGTLPAGEINYLTVGKNGNGLFVER